MSFFSRLKAGLTKSTAKISEGIASIIHKRKLDDTVLAELEDLLISCDLGVATSAQIIENFRRQKFGKEVSDEEIKQSLAEAIATILKPVAQTLTTDSPKPATILVVGVNGNGKTTTIGKLAAQFKAQGKSVMLAACDTFRAAAVEQLQIWGERNNAPVVTGPTNSDPASVAHQALERAKAEQMDILILDTAGRLQNKTGLMEELKKIRRVLTKLDETAPQHTLLILDATTGQNAHSQVETFKEMVAITGLIVTKLDGSAKAGVVVALADTFKLPIYAIGVGEKIDDLQPFDPDQFARNLVGL